MARKPTSKPDRSSRAKKSARATRARAGVKQVLYDRVTGRSQEVTVLPSAPTPERHRTTFTLHHAQRVRLDELCARILQTTGVRVSPSVIVRGLLDALSDSRLDLTGCRSEADVRTAVRRRLGRS